MGMEIDRILESLSRCRRTDDLEVHFKTSADGNGLDNALVLCKHCREINSFINSKVGCQPKFDPEICAQAIQRAQNRCECTGCPACNSIFGNAVEKVAKTQE